MAGEKPKQGDKLPTFTSPLQRNKEPGPLILNNEAADLTRMVDDTLPPFPFFSIEELGGMPQSCANGMPFPPISMMDNASQFNFSHYPEINHNYLYGAVSDFSCVEGNINECAQSYNFQDLPGTANVMTSATQVNELGKSQIESNAITTRADMAQGLQICKPLLIGNQINHGGSASVSAHNPTGAEIGIKDNIMTSSAQSDHHELLDGSFLTLGMGDNRDTRRNSNVSSTGTDKTKSTALPRLNISGGQNIDSYLNSGSNVACGFSSFQNNVGGFSSLAQNDDGFSSLGQNVGEFFYPVQTEGGGTLSPLVDVQHFHHLPSNWNLGLGEKRDARFVDGYPNTGFQGFPTESSMLHNSNQVGIPDYGQYRPAGFPSSSSLIRRSATRPALDCLQNPQVGIIGNFSPDPTMVSPFDGVTRSITRQNQSVGQPFRADEVRAALFAEDVLMSNNIRVQQSGNLGQRQTNIPVQPSKNLCGPVCTTGQEIAATNGPARAASIPLGPASIRTATKSAPAIPQPSNVHQGPSLKRCTTESPLAIHQVHKKARSTMPSSHLSTPNGAQTTLSDTSTAWTALLSPPVAQNAPFRPPAVQAALSHPPIVQTAPSRAPVAQPSPFRPPPPKPGCRLPLLPKESTRPHIKWQDPDKILKPSGNQCHICKRDLSYVPEGPVYQPVNPPPVAVLPCHHHFHAYCLELITPENQAQNPPCIPCAMGDKN